MDLDMKEKNIMNLTIKKISNGYILKQPDLISDIRTETFKANKEELIKRIEHLIKRDFNDF